MGPLVTREHRDKVASYVASAEQAGADVVTDGRGTPPGVDGFFLAPTLIDRVTPEMESYHNDLRAGAGDRPGWTRGGRAARQREPVRQRHRIFSDGGAARQFQFEAAGMVGINVPIPVPVAYHSLVAGRTRSSATCTCTARRASSSTRGRR
jgi:malonate-semialdehyde dehydrogenase (acetylating)/methylmalonate-semialdehyde dehydrogenase